MGFGIYLVINKLTAFFKVLYGRKRGGEEYSEQEVFTCFLDFCVLASCFMLAVPPTLIYNGFLYVASTQRSIIRSHTQHTGLMLQMLLSCFFTENVALFQGTALYSVHLQI